MYLLRSLAPAFALAALMPSGALTPSAAPAALAALTPLAAQRDPAFAVAMLRRDGVLIPFGVFDGRSWTTPWPAPAYRLEAPLTMAGIRRQWWGRVEPSSAWIAWPAHGDPRTIHVRAPVVIPAHCLSTVGLQTDYTSTEPVPPPTQHHHPKDGVATTGTQAVVPIEVLDDSSLEWASTLELIGPAIEKAESKEPPNRAAIATTAWRRRGVNVPLRLEVLCRSKASVSGDVVYYFEAARRFPPGRGASVPGSAQGDRTVRSDGGVDVFSQGFVVLDGRTIVRESITTTFTNTARDEADFGLPLGSLTVNGREHWIMHAAGRGRERYLIVEVGPRTLRTVVEVFGGGC